MTAEKGSWRLFRLFGIEVWLSWYWLLAAAVELQFRSDKYPSLAWNIAEYLTLFGIVLLHEFGHALACRSVGGTALRIVLWPLGGVAFVDPPQRPGPVLWSIVAGPLVNMVLVPVTLVAWYLSSSGIVPLPEAAQAYVSAVALMNIALLVFNLLPVYPLDGGQILHSLLWFVMRRERALAVVTALGFLGALALGALAAWNTSFWTGLMALFIGWKCWWGVKRVLWMTRARRLPIHPVARCPSCGEPAPVGFAALPCDCGEATDPFGDPATCPSCGAPPTRAICVYCLKVSPYDAWVARHPRVA